MNTESKTASGHSILLWSAGVVLAFLLGAATMNGYSTQSALNAAKGACHWTIKHELRRQRSMLESQE